MAKPAIPSIPNDPENVGFNRAIKECLETIMGRRAAPIIQLTTDATNSDLINKINEIIQRLQ